MDMVSHPRSSAGFSTRLLAHNIDLAILLPYYYLVSLLPVANATVYLICVLSTFLYEIIFVASKWHGTPGKKMLHLKVEGLRQQRPSLAQSALRTLVKALSVPTLLIGYALLAFHPMRKGLHDMAAKTLVVFDEKT